MLPPALTQKEEKVFYNWKDLYMGNAEELDSESDKDGIDWDWECFCLGWCMAKGFSVKEAKNFYKKMISRGLF